MNFEMLQQMMRNSLQMSVGATVSLLETLQDPLKREQGIADLQRELSELPTMLQDPYQRELKLNELQLELMHRSEDWVQKGQTTEHDARDFVEMLFSQVGLMPARDRQQPTTINITATTVTNSSSANYQRELQALTFEISSLRSELENQRQQNTK